MTQTIILKNNEATHVKVITYPDGQHTVQLDLDSLNVKEPIIIKCRIKNFADLEVLFCIIAALRKHDFLIEEIDFLYMFGMRSDRAFNIGEPNYCRDVITPLLNTMLGDAMSNFNWPHSYLSRFPVKNSVNYFNVPDFIENDHMIGGDESVACHWVNYKFIKKRLNGQISVTLRHDDFINLSQSDSDITIIDDMCDGGATFIAEGRYLKEHFPERKLKLFVAHGLFSKGFHELFQYFDEIITTNSYQDFPNLQHIEEAYPGKKLTIINVFDGEN